MAGKNSLFGNRKKLRADPGRPSAACNSQEQQALSTEKKIHNMSEYMWYMNYNEKKKRIILDPELSFRWT